MLYMNATDVRKNWSYVSENVIRTKPTFIKKTRDHMVLSNVTFVETLLSGYEFNASKYIEDDGSITLSLDNLDIVENADNEEQALLKLSEAILEYANDFYEEYELWSSAPNKKLEIPYVFKALVLNSSEAIKEHIICQAGKN